MTGSALSARLSSRSSALRTWPPCAERRKKINSWGDYGYTEDCDPEQGLFAWCLPGTAGAYALIAHADDHGNMGYSEMALTVNLYQVAMGGIALPSLVSGAAAGLGAEFSAVLVGTILQFNATRDPAEAPGWPVGYSPNWVFYNCTGTGGNGGAPVTVAFNSSGTSYLAANYLSQSAVTAVNVVPTVTVNVNSGLSGAPTNIARNATSGNAADVCITKVTTGPNWTYVLQLDSTAHASFGGNATVSLTTTNAADGASQHVSLIPGGTVGPYTITPMFVGSNGSVQAGSPVSGTVFDFKLVVTGTSFSPARDPQSEPLPENGHISIDTTGKTANTMYAKDVAASRFAYFVTDPQGSYSSYLKATLDISQEFDDCQDNPSPWGVYVFKNYQWVDGITMSLSFHMVNISANSGEGAISAWAGAIRVKTPNHQAWRDFSLPQAQVSASQIPLNGWKWLPIHNTPDELSFLDHFHVGDSSSRAEAQSQHSCSGASANLEAYTSCADANMSALVQARPAVVVNGSLVPTDQQSP